MTQVELPRRQNTSPRIALVLGATGGAGAAIALALHRHHWHVRALTRSVEAARQKFPDLSFIDWFQGDALDGESVIDAAFGTSAIIHAVNPPGYKNWDRDVLPMLENSMEAARRANARLVVPGNVYNFGPDAGPVVNEQSPQNPLTRKGRIRVDMETMLQESAQWGLRSLVVRAGDFFGATGKSSWFNDGMITKGRPLTRVVYPGDPEVGHAWAYLPDLAQTIALLLDHESRLADADRFHFGGHYLPRGIEIAHSVRRVVGKPDLPIRSMPWFLFYLLAPFVTFMRESLEMRYLWRRPLKLDNAKLVAFLGMEPHTPLDRAIAETLGALGCLEQTPKTQPKVSGTKRSAAIL